ncbi:hypothetical protein CPB86DRAFT_779731 [Serendipita vermifera]|jgi:hypothetical protein|nr:hypothetical protein CPB86DRAFT_779731 [Serendipita vermifera]
MFDGALAIALIDGQVSLVQVVHSSRTSSHLEVIRYTFFGDMSFLANFTSSPPTRIASSDVLQFLPSSIKPSGDTVTLSAELFTQFVDRSTANQIELEAKWQKALAMGGPSFPHATFTKTR